MENTMPKVGTKEFNDLASACFGGKPKQETLEEAEKYPIGGYAPGNYMCNCSICKIQFQGDKRAVQCEPCAIKMTKEEPKKEYKYIGECKGNNGNGCFMDSCGHDCGCFTIQERSYTEEEVLELIQFLSDEEDFKENSSISIFIAKDYLNQFKNK